MHCFLVFLLNLLNYIHAIEAVFIKALGSQDVCVPITFFPLLEYKVLVSLK